MTEEFVTGLLALTLKTIALLCAPILVTCLVVGVVTNLLQTVTQVRDSAVSFVPKLLAAAVVLVATAPWCMQILMGFWNQIMDLFGRPIL